MDETDKKIVDYHHEDKTIMRDYDASENDVDSFDKEPDELTLLRFFEITFGSEHVDFDSTQFVADELTVDIVVQMVNLAQQNPQQGILRNLFPYFIDILGRTISFGKLVDCIQAILADNPNSILDCLADCSARDFLVAFLHQIPDKAMPKMLGTLVSSNIPIPVLLTDEHELYHTGLRVLSGMRDLVSAKNYCLLLSFNLTTTQTNPPFSKQLFPVLCRNREDSISLCHPGSIDISFHSASENRKRQPVAIAEVYNTHGNSKVLESVADSLSQMACLIIIHISEEDFNGTQPKTEFQRLIYAVSANQSDHIRRRILVLFKDNKQKKKDTTIWNNRKQNIEKLLSPNSSTDVCDEIIIKMITASNIRKQLDVVKNDIFTKILEVDQPYLRPPLAIAIHETQTSIWPGKTTGDLFARYMRDAGFVPGISTFRRRHIFLASYAEQQIESLKDKRHLTTLEDSGEMMSEADVCAQIDIYENNKVSIGDKEPLSILIFFAQGIIANDINKMREFARDADDFFKVHLRDLSNLDQSEQISNQRIKQQIEDHDISIHDFWREFVILARTDLSHYTSIAKKLYNVDIKSLENAYKTWVSEGEAMQMLDGLSLRPLDTTFLSRVLTSIMTDPNRKLLVISVIGFENSGKSTLLNYLFKCGFSTSGKRCTKGMYMSYRHSVFQNQPIDLLVLDSEGMGSTAQKFITRRSRFDKKITLFTLICSQIVIINTKGLTREIGDILEVSSFHLDALKVSKTKPRLHFVVRDMIESSDAQKPAFDDIRASLEKMFHEIPGCAQNLDDFMIVEQKDVHLLVNAFSSFNDDFRPRVENISENDSIHVPAETFPLKASNLRQALLESALDSTYYQETKMFDNVNGFIIQMKSTWAAIDARGSFLHFNDFKTIQTWNGMKAIVHNMQQKLVAYKVEVNSKILEHIEDLQADCKKWDDVHHKFFNVLSSVTAKHCDKTLSEFNQQAASQFDNAIKDEGRNLIRDMFATEKISLETKWLEKEREYKETALMNNAEEELGRAIQKYKSPQEAEDLKRDKNRRDKLFNDAWKDVEQSHANFMQSIVDDDNQLYQLVHLFNRAISDGQSTIKKQSTNQVFNRKFWMNLEKAEILMEKGIDLEHSVENLIELKPVGLKNRILRRTNNINMLFGGINMLFGGTNNINMHFGGTMVLGSTNETRGIFGYNEEYEAKEEAIQAVLEEFDKVTSAICHEIQFHKSLRVEYGETSNWLQRLCNALFIVVGNFNKPHVAYHMELREFNIFEKCLRLQVFQTLRSNTEKWRSEQEQKLEERKTNLKNRLDNLLVNNSAQNLSSELAKDIIEVVKKHISSKESTIKDSVDDYLRNVWVNKYGATHWAHAKSFGKKDPNAVREYLMNIDKFMRKIFDEECRGGIEIQVKKVITNIVKEIQEIRKNLFCEIDNVWSCRGKSTLEQVLATSKRKAIFDFMKRFSNIFGKYTIDNPRKFCEFLKKYLSPKFDELENEWRTDYHIERAKQRLHQQAEETIKANWDVLEGCTARCPACDSKCEDVKGTNHTHFTSTHVMTSFAGYRNKDTNQATLIVCSEPEANKRKWRKSKEDEFVEINELMESHEPAWRPVEFKDVTDAEIRNMRGVWWNLREEWCQKYNMEDSTPDNWVQYAR